MPIGLLTIARCWLGVRELPDNRGLRVEAVQHYSGGVFGDSWCAEMWWLWHDLFFRCAGPVPRFQAVQTFYDLAKQRGWLTNMPAPGSTFMLVNAADHAHHIGVVTDTAPLAGIAGNTSSDGESSNGDGVYEHRLTVQTPFLRFANVPGVVA